MDHDGLRCRRCNSFCRELWALLEKMFGDCISSVDYLLYCGPKNSLVSFWCSVVERIENRLTSLPQRVVILIIFNQPLSTYILIFFFLLFRRIGIFLAYIISCSSVLGALFHPLIRKKVGVLLRITFQANF